MCEVGLGDEAARHAAHLIRVSNMLTWLSLCNNGIGTLGMATLGMCTHCACMRTLHMALCMCMCTVFALCLRTSYANGACAPHEYCASTAGEALATNGSLRRVDLRGNHCGDAGAFAFSEVP